MMAGKNSTSYLAQPIEQYQNGSGLIGHATLLVDSKKIPLGFKKLHFRNQDAPRLKRLYLLSFSIHVQPIRIVTIWGESQLV